MKLKEAIQRIDSLKHNTYSRDDKIAWLSRLDSMVKAQIIDTHEGGDEISFDGYDNTTSLDTELLVPSPYDDVYLRWLEAQIDYANGENDRYNTAIIMFETIYNGYSNAYNREHMPLSNGFKYF